MGRGNSGNGAKRVGYEVTIGALTVLVAVLAAKDQLIWAVILIAAQLVLLVKVSAARQRA